MAEGLHRLRCAVEEPGDHAVREFQPFGLLEQVLGKDLGQGYAHPIRHFCLLCPLSNFLCLLSVLLCLLSVLLCFLSLLPDLFCSLSGLLCSLPGLSCSLSGLLALLYPLCSPLYGLPPRCLQLLLHLHQDHQLVDEPTVDPGQLMDLLVGHAPPEGLRDHPDPPVVLPAQLLVQLLVGEMAKIVAHQAVHMLLQGADRLHQGALEVDADAHHLAGGLHLGPQGPLGADEFVKGQTGHLHHAVVQHGLKAGIGLPRDRVLDLI